MARRCCLQAKRRGLRRTQACLHIDVRFLASRARDKNPGAESIQSVRFCCGSPSTRIQCSFHNMISLMNKSCLKSFCKVNILHKYLNSRHSIIRVDSYLLMLVRGQGSIAQKRESCRPRKHKSQLCYLLARGPLVKFLNIPCVLPHG